MRVVSLCPSLTELVFDLGRGADLVARTKFCVHPAAGVASVEKVGGTKNPKIERIIELAPDLVLLNEEENRREDAVALREAGIAYHTSMPRTAEETAMMVRSIGTAIGSAGAAETIAAAIEQGAGRARRAAAQLPPVRYAYLIWRRPWMTLSDDTFIAALLALPGGVNVFGAEVDRYPVITAEQLAVAAPERVFLSSEPFPFREDHAEELAAASGLPRPTFHFVDGELLSWHGSRTVAGIDYAVDVLRGDGSSAPSGPV